MLNNLLCADALITGMLVADGILFAVAIGLLVWYFVKNKNKSSGKKTNLVTPIQKVDDDTYVIEGEKQEVVEEQPASEKDNNVVHFINQIADINGERNSELNANTVVVNHEVEIPVKKAVVKDEIENFVVIGGEKKAKEEVSKTANRGTNAYKNATNFFNTIKSEQAIESNSTSTKKTTKK